MTRPNLSGNVVMTVFYGLEPTTVSIEEFYKLLISWFQSLGSSPDKIAVRGPGFSEKPIGFRNGDVRLQKGGFSHVEAVSLYSLASGWVIPLSDWRSIAIVNLLHNSYFTACAHEATTLFDDCSFNQLQTQAVRLLKPRYGFCCDMEHDKGPSFYAAGINYVNSLSEIGSGDSEQKLSISRWRDIGMHEQVYKNGIIRDVYPFNYLSDVHLKMKVEGQTFQAWVASDPARGTLEKIGDRITLWKISPECIASVRETLWSEGIVFNWRSYLPS